tara:strand:- start:342 stop:533 length:192 start_codon:yes stop_codon:yes gene_type:complete
MKLNAIRAFIIVAFCIIILYALGLFLPIILKSKPKVNLVNDNKIVVQEKFLNLKNSENKTKKC